MTTANSTLLKQYIPGIERLSKLDLKNIQEQIGALLELSDQTTKIPETELNSLLTTAKEIKTGINLIFGTKITTLWKARIIWTGKLSNSSSHLENIELDTLRETIISGDFYLMNGEKKKLPNDNPEAGSWDLMWSYLLSDRDNHPAISDFEKKVIDFSKQVSSVANKYGITPQALTDYIYAEVYF